MEGAAFTAAASALHCAPPQANQKVQDLETELFTANEEKSQLRTELDASQGEMKSLQEKVEGLEGKLRDLEQSKDDKQVREAALLPPSMFAANDSLPLGPWL